MITAKKAKDITLTNRGNIAGITKVINRKIGECIDMGIDRYQYIIPSGWFEMTECKVEDVRDFYLNLGYECYFRVIDSNYVFLIAW